MIVECSFDDQMRAYPIRIREDKTAVYKETNSVFGNDFSTARNNFENAMDPITLDFLKGEHKNVYFNIQ